MNKILLTDEKQQKEAVHLLLDIGDTLLCSGADVSRVEDTIRRMARSMGAEDVNTFAITSSIVLTLRFSDGQLVTESRRIKGVPDTDFDCIKRLNDLSREFCRTPVMPDVLRRMYEKATEAVKEEKTGVRAVCKNYAGHALAGGGCAVFFGGSIFDGLAAALIGLAVAFLGRNLGKRCPNRMTYNIIASFFAGMLICLAQTMIPSLHRDMIMIGDIMLMIPGIAATNSVRDIFMGDTISGVMRLTECILWAGALACGFMLSMWIWGGLFG